MTPAEKRAPEPDTALTPVKWLLWAAGRIVRNVRNETGGRGTRGARAALQAVLRRGAALLLCLGAWTVAVFLVYDSVDRWLGSAKAGRAMTGVLAFPFSLLAAAGALTLTVRVVRRWKLMGEAIAADPDAVDTDRADSYLNHPPKDPDSEGR